MLECPEQVIKKPKEEVPETKVLVGEGEWGPVARILCGRGICEEAVDEEIPRFFGKLVANGMFEVMKKWLPLAARHRANFKDATREPIRSDSLPTRCASTPATN